MTVDAIVEQARTAVRTACRCRHYLEAHAPGFGPCLRTLPEVVEEELPAWRCPCPHFQPWLPA